MERVENMCKDDFYLKSGALFVMIVISSFFQIQDLD